jgi:diazepam-binding inhibitor (GABA receptor modulating acyl-CoA-binding protein)
MSDSSDQRFLKAYEMACTTSLKFPPDVMLHFYAYYKRATTLNGSYAAKGEDVRNGFKANALIQVEPLSQAEAKNKYIDMVEKHIGEI